MTLQQVAGSQMPTMNGMPGPEAQPSLPETNPILLALEQARLEKKKLAWASWVNTEYEKCKQGRANAERQWYINLAFYNGRQNVAPVSISGTGFKLTVPNVPPWRIRLVVNKVRSAIRRETAKLASARPIPTVVPSTGEDEDHNAARVAEQLLKTAFSGAEFENCYRSWLWWGSVCGTSFLKSYWDSTAIDKDAQLPPTPFTGLDGQPVMGQDGQPLMMESLPVKGMIKYERITPFHIYVPDLLSEDLQKQAYIVHVTTRSPAWIKRHFPDVVPTPDAKSSNTIMETAFLTKGAQEQILDTCLIKEMWLKPDAHPDFPQGGVITVVNDKVAQVQETWPWPFDEYPFYKYSGIPTGGFYGDSIIVDLIPLQKEYNKTRSQMVEIKNVMGKPKFFYQKGSVNPRQISSEPGQGIPYEVGFNPPVPMAGMEVPVSMHNELDRLIQDFDDISGQHEVSRGKNPGQVTSATAIAFLQEQDDSLLNHQVASIESAIEMLGKHYLKYVTTFWDNPRLIKVAGKDNSFEAVSWKGNDLKGNTDVKVQTGSALPYSKAARQAMVTEFMQNGWFDVATGMELMQLGGFDKIVDELLVDKKQAGRENQKMLKLNPQDIAQAMQPPVGQDGRPMVNPETGEPAQPRPLISVNSWDNHEAHVLYHNQFRKTQEFELASDEVKMQFELHTQYHQQALSMLMVGQTGQLNDPNAQPMEDTGGNPSGEGAGQPAPQG